VLLAILVLEVIFTFNEDSDLRLRDLHLAVEHTLSTLRVKELGEREGVATPARELVRLLDEEPGEHGDLGVGARLVNDPRENATLALGGALRREASGAAGGPLGGRLLDDLLAGYLAGHRRRRLLGGSLGLGSSLGGHLGLGSRLRLADKHGGVSDAAARYLAHLHARGNWRDERGSPTGGEGGRR